MKVHKTYSLNIKVVEAFEQEVAPQTRSQLLEALMIKFLVEYVREPMQSPDKVEPLGKGDVND